MTTDFQPLVSIVTPTLNPGPRLRRCIESVLAQSYAHVEHVVVDGGSTDGTLELLRELPHLRWISEPDSGQSSAINKGFSLATGTILGWLNADDVLLPGAIAKVVDVFESNPRIGWVYGNVKTVWPGGFEVRRPTKVNRPRTWAARNPVPQPGAFNTRWALELVGPLDERFHYEMDCDLWLRMIAAKVPHRHVDDVLAEFEIHEESKSGSVPEEVFILEEARARLKNGWHRSGSVAVGRAIARAVYRSGGDPDRDVGELIEEHAKDLMDETHPLRRDLVLAGIRAESAVVAIRDAGIRGTPRLFVFDIWRHGEARRRVMDALRRQISRRWQRAVARLRT